LSHLYDSLDKQFAYGLDRILDGFGISHDFPAPTVISLVGNPQPTIGGDSDAGTKVS
jgi:hypothetical protein